MSERRSRTRLSFEETPGRWGKNIIIPTISVLACFLWGATEKWSEGIVMALFGLLLLATPPRRSLGIALNLILLGFAVCAAAAFLPANWFGSPAWREVLTNNFGIILPNTVSLQPYVSL